MVPWHVGTFGYDTSELSVLQKPSRGPALHKSQAGNASHMLFAVSRSELVTPR